MNSTHNTSLVVRLTFCFVACTLLFSFTIWRQKFSCHRFRIFIRSTIYLYSSWIVKGRCSVENNRVFTNAKMAILTLDVFLQENETLAATKSYLQWGLNIQPMGCESNAFPTELFWHVLIRGSLNWLLFKYYLTFWIWMI